MAQMAAINLEDPDLKKKFDMPDHTRMYLDMRHQCVVIVESTELKLLRPKLMTIPLSNFLQLAGQALITISSPKTAQQSAQQPSQNGKLVLPG